MNNPAQQVYAYVLECAANEPTARRATIYRNLAAVIGDEALARNLCALAAELEEIDRRCRQLSLKL